MHHGPNRLLALRGVDLTRIPPMNPRGLTVNVPPPPDGTDPIDEATLEVEIFDLGSELRKSLFRDELDWDTLARIEALLFRHATLSFRWLRDIFDDAGDELRPHVARVHARLMDPAGLTAYQAARNRDMCYRLLSILQVICPEVITLAASAA